MTKQEFINQVKEKPDSRRRRRRPRPLTQCSTRSPKPSSVAAKLPSRASASSACPTAVHVRASTRRPASDPDRRPARCRGSRPVRSSRRPSRAADRGFAVNPLATASQRSLRNERVNSSSVSIPTRPNFGRGRSRPWTVRPRRSPMRRPQKPSESRSAGRTPADVAADAVSEHCRSVIAAVGAECVGVKLQLACFERLGAPGCRALAETVQAAKQDGLIVIADGKRGDVPVTAAAYAQSLFGSDADPVGRRARARRRRRHGQSADGRRLARAVRRIGVASTAPECSRWCAPPTPAPQTSKT